MILDHIGMAVSDYQRSRAFYAAALAPLHIEQVAEVRGWCGFGRAGKPEFWFVEGASTQPPLQSPLLPKAGRRWMRSTRRRWRPVGQTTAPPVCVRSITRTITEPLSSTRMATTLRRSAMPRSRCNAIARSMTVWGRVCPVSDLRRVVGS